MPFFFQCRACGASSPTSAKTCGQCHASLIGSPRVWPRASRALAAAEGSRPERTKPCASCGADNPLRFVKCQSCGGPTDRVKMPAHRQCRECDEWNDGSFLFCALCGAPMALMDEAAHWRPDGCPGCWGDVVAQPGLQYCGTCGAGLPSTLLERRDVLGGLAARRARGDYRSHRHPPRLHEARCELVLRDARSVVWLALRNSPHGVVAMDITAEVGDSEGPPPATPGPLSELVRWVRRRLDKSERAAAEQLVSRAEAFGVDDERVLRAERVGPLLRVRVEFATQPTAARLDAWVEWVVDEV